MFSSEAGGGEAEEECLISIERRQEVGIFTVLSGHQRAQSVEEKLNKPLGRFTEPENKVGQKSYEVSGLLCILGNFPQILFH